MIYPISGGAPPPDPPGPPGPDPPGPPPPPPTVPHLVFSPAGAVPGSFWVEGSEWHYISHTGEEWGGTGSADGVPGGAVPGSFWVDGDSFRYIDQSGIQRTLQPFDQGPSSGQGAGSIWVETQQPTGKQWSWLGTTRRVQWWNGF